MSLNRDLAVLFASSHFPPAKRLRACDPMAGTGVRTARYLLETSNIASIVAGDNDRAATELVRQTVRINGLEDRATVLRSDAHTLLSQHSKDRFDLIDLDPFGSPAPFFESALRATSTGGVIAATATDMGPLSGARPSACLRKYGVSSIRTEFEKEFAVRVLASSLMSAASRLELGITIAFTHATDHYARTYAIVTKGRKEANQSLNYFGYVVYCPKCLYRVETYSVSAIPNKCANCGAATKAGGPFWVGPLWERQTVEAMIHHTPTLLSSRLNQVQRMLGLIEGEAGLPRFYYTTDSVASVYHVKPRSVVSLVESLRAGGFQASRTHFNPAGFRTNAPFPSIVASFQTRPEKAQP